MSTKSKKLKLVGTALFLSWPFLLGSAYLLATSAEAETPSIGSDQAPAQKSYWEELTDFTNKMLNRSIEDTEVIVSDLRRQIIKDEFNIPQDVQTVTVSLDEVKAILLKDHKGDQKLVIYQVYDPVNNTLYVVNNK